MIARKLNPAQDLFYEIMEILTSYKIMPCNSPNIGLSYSSREGDKMHLLALRQICKLCLEALDSRYQALFSQYTTQDIFILNNSNMEDDFERVIFYADMDTLDIIEDHLIACMEKINMLYKIL
jgi:hypothetical protein